MTRAMATPALRQRDLFEEQLETADVWADRLAKAFAAANAGVRLLPLAEEAIAACPKDWELLLLAATAAVLDKRPERALALLGPFFKRGRAPAAYLLHALALDQLGRGTDAKAILQHHGLTSRISVLAAFSHDFPGLSRLLAPLDRIVREAAPRSVRRAGAVANAHATRKATAKRQAGAKPTAASSGAAPSARSQRSSPSAAAAAPEPPLPRIEVEIPFTMEIDL